MQFLNLNADERRVLLESLESVLGRNARVLETIATLEQRINQKLSL